MEQPSKDIYAEFNKFQSAFYLSTNDFKDFTRFEITRHGYTLLNNLSKGFPNLADIILNLRGLEWSGPTSKQLLIALQRKFCNNLIAPRIPKFIYYKTEKTSTKKDKKEIKEDKEIIDIVCNTYIIDTKTFEQLKNTKRIKELIMQIKGEFEQQNKSKRKRKQN